MADEKRRERRESNSEIVDTPFRSPYSISLLLFSRHWRAAALIFPAVSTQLGRVNQLCSRG